MVGESDGSAVGRFDGEDDGSSEVGLAVVGLEVIGTGALVGFLEGDKVDGASVAGVDEDDILVADNVGYYFVGCIGDSVVLLIWGYYGRKSILVQVSSKPNCHVYRMG